MLSLQIVNFLVAETLSCSFQNQKRVSNTWKKDKDYFSDSIPRLATRGRNSILSVSSWCLIRLILQLCVLRLSYLCVHVCSVALVVSDSLQLLWTVARQLPLSKGFSRQEQWSGLPCPSPEDLPNPGIKPASLLSPALAGRFFTTSATWEAYTFLGLILSLYDFQIYLSLAQFLPFPDLCRQLPTVFTWMSHRFKVNLLCHLQTCLFSYDPFCSEPVNCFLVP